MKSNREKRVVVRAYRRSKPRYANRAYARRSGASQNNTGVRVKEVDEASALQGDASQAWYWSAGWCQQEKEAEEDLRAGRYKDFSSMEEFLDDLSVDE